MKYMKRFFVATTVIFAAPLIAQDKPAIKPAKNTWAPTYVIALEIRQTRFSLDLFEHAKDAMNAATFQIPVSKDYYDAVQVGTVLNNKFRAGSMVFHGSFGNWQIKVVNKAIF
jgi:hypothetical protein